MKMNLLTLLRMMSFSGLLAVGFAPSAHAVPSVTLDPVTQTISVGDTAVVNLNIAGLDAGLPPTLAAWLAHIAYNTAVVNPTGVTFGTNLSLGVLGTIQFTDLTAPGLVQADETSFEDMNDLNAAQPDAFTLATLSFVGVAPGVSTLSFDRLELGDEVGFPLNYTSSSASITVTGGNSVPDGGSLMVPLAACFAAVLLVQRRRVAS